MKALIYKYFFNKKTYYAEGYEEEDIRSSLEKHLKVTTGSLKKGVVPSYRKELIRIWDPKETNSVFTLTLNKRDTTSNEKLSDYKTKQHVLYELNLLLKEDINFLNGINDIVTTNANNEVKLWYKHNVYKTNKNGETYIDEKGYDMCYSFKGSTDDIDTSKIYRFKNLSKAYWYVRNQLIKFGLDDKTYKRSSCTNLEICDSFITGFGNADIYKSYSKLDGETVEDLSLKSFYSFNFPKSLELN